MIIPRKLDFFEVNLEILWIQCISKTFNKNDDRNTQQKVNFFPFRSVMRLGNWAIKFWNLSVYDQKLFPKETCNNKTIPGKNWIISQGEIINF